MASTLGSLLSDDSDIPAEDGQKNEESKLFPRSNDAKKSFVADIHFRDSQQFQNIFKSCEVAYRHLSDCDIEINPSCGIFLEFPTMEHISQAFTKFETIYITFCQTRMDFQIFPSSNLIFRQFQSMESVFAFVLSICQPQSFIRAKESLHEFILSSFPTVSHSLALYLLSRGIIFPDQSLVKINEYQSSLYPLTVLLDTPTIKFTQKASLPIPRGRKKASKKEEPGILAYIPSRNRTAAEDINRKSN